MKFQDLHLDYQLVEDILKAFLFNELRKFGFSSVVLGLSGGIDSAVVMTLELSFGSGFVELPSVIVSFTVPYSSITVAVVV